MAVAGSSSPVQRVPVGSRWSPATTLSSQKLHSSSSLIYLHNWLMTGRSWELDFSGTVKIQSCVLELCSTGKKKKKKKSPHFLIIHIRNLLKTPFPDGLKETRGICTECTECSFQGYVAPRFGIASQRHTRNLTPMFNYVARLQPNNLDIQSSGCLDKHLDIHLNFIKVESKPLEILPGLAWCMLLYPPKRSPHPYLSSTTKSQHLIWKGFVSLMHCSDQAWLSFLTTSCYLRVLPLHLLVLPLLALPVQKVCKTD